VLEQRDRGDAGIDAEVLRQIAESLPEKSRIGDDVGAVERDRSGVRLLQRRNGA
jgi:hypothetical protein